MKLIRLIKNGMIIIWNTGIDMFTSLFRLRFEKDSKQPETICVEVFHCTSFWVRTKLLPWLDEMTTSERVHYSNVITRRVRRRDSAPPKNWSAEKEILHVDATDNILNQIKQCSGQSKDISRFFLYFYLRVLILILIFKCLIEMFYKLKKKNNQNLTFPFLGIFIFKREWNVLKLKKI